jgi:transposase-like protein
MVEAVRAGASLRHVARRFGVALSTVQRWVARAGHQRLDRVDWTDLPCGLPTPVNRTERSLEDLILTIRHELRDTSDLGEFGALAIHRELLARRIAEPPSVRTIGLILQRPRALDARCCCAVPPVSGWYPMSPMSRVELTASMASRGWSFRGHQVGFSTASLHGG